MTDWVPIALIVYILVGLVLAKWITAGTVIEEKLEAEASSLIEGHHAPGLFLFLLAVVLWPVMLLLGLLSSRGNKKN